MEKNSVNVFDPEIQEKYHIEALYVKVHCLECDSYWGVSAVNSLVDPAKLVCRVCAVQKTFEAVNK